MKKVIQATLLLLINVSFTGCILDTNKNPLSNGINDYFPMQVGNSWTYVYNTESTEKRETYSIVKSQQIGNKTYFVFDKMPPFIRFELGLDMYAMRTDKNGDILLSYGYKGNSEIVVFNFTVGEMYSKYGNETIITTLESVSDSVTTFLETFTDCYRYMSNMKEVRDTEFKVWFARGVGPVLIKTLAYTNDYFLESATIN